MNPEARRKLYRLYKQWHLNIYHSRHGSCLTCTLLSLCDWREWQSHGKAAVISVRFYLFMKMSLQLSHQNRPEKAIVPSTELH